MIHNSYALKNKVNLNVSVKSLMFLDGAVDDHTYCPFKQFKILYQAVCYSLISIIINNGLYLAISKQVVMSQYDCTKHIRCFMLSAYNKSINLMIKYKKCKTI